MDITKSITRTEYNITFSMRMDRVPVMKRKALVRGFGFRKKLQNVVKSNLGLK